MGYRSEVYIKIDNSLVQIFEELLQGVSLIERFESLGSTNGFTKYRGLDLKWYDSYSDVKTINDFCDQHYTKCGLLGIGEDGAQSAYAGEPDELDMYIISDIHW